MDILNQLDELERYLDVMEGFLDKRAARVRDNRERWELAEHFPNLLRSSAFVAVYAMVETELNRLCRKLAPKDGLAVEDLTGSGILRAATYLTRVCEVNFPEDSENWKQLKVFNQLRNLVVHSEGKVDKDNSHLQKQVKNQDQLDLAEDGRLIFGREFCPAAIAVARGFFRELAQQLK